tara:strand:- start:160 stop:579 length:420 start_codon:yes stop_codon:yes gene_type:complete
MKYFKINLKLTYSIIFIIFFLQIILVAYRNSFSIQLINKFYKKNIGLESGQGIKGIQSGQIANIIKIINQNNLKKYKLNDDLIKSEDYNLSQKIKLMAFEGTYPSRYDQNSKNIITKLNEKENCKVKDKINKIYLLICE